MTNCYAIKAYISDGRYGYVSMNYDGTRNWHLESDVSAARLFRTIAEAKDFYYEYVRGAVDDRTGARVINEKTAVVGCYDPTL